MKLPPVYDASLVAFWGTMSGDERVASALYADERDATTYDNHDLAHGWACVSKWEADHLLATVTRL